MTEYASGNIYIRTNHMERRGEVLPGHKHNFDHHTLVVAGGIRVRRRAPDGTEDEVESWAGELGLLIKAECEHEITALADETLFLCVYAHRNPQDGKVIQTYNGWANAYR